ncbi:MAG: hypothetical protein EOP14_00155 [Pseudomonas sp.]|nr:MAG: hypothetical protein EOP14_00155 [Pseudomonas sp.]
MTAKKEVKQEAVDTAQSDAKPEEIQHFPELSDSEREKAEKEGVKAAYAQSAQTNFSTRSATESETTGDRWPDRHDVMRFAHIIDLGLDAFVAAVDAKAEPSVPESKVAGLLELERSGKNRTEYVKALCARLGVKSPYEVTSAGPGHTNDVSSINSLFSK